MAAGGHPLLFAFQNPFAKPAPNPYTGFGLQLAQAIDKKKQDDQILAQILQAFGYAKPMDAFGMIPPGASTLVQDGQAYLRRGGIDPQTQNLLYSLLGVRQRGSTGGIQDPRSVGQKGGGI